MTGAMSGADSTSGRTMTCAMSGADSTLSAARARASLSAARRLVRL